MGNRFKARIHPTDDPGDKTAAAAHVRELVESDFDDELHGVLPVVLQFYGTESKPCEVLAPRFAAVAERFAGRVRFLKVLRDANPNLAAQLGVSANPTLIFLAGGKEVGGRLVGDAIKRTELKARVEAMLGDPVAISST
jgi:thioredoxin-like negative regulator of GroEL